MLVWRGTADTKRREMGALVLFFIPGETVATESVRPQAFTPLACGKAIPISTVVGVSASLMRSILAKSLPSSTKPFWAVSAAIFLIAASIVVALIRGSIRSMDEKRANPL